MKRIAIIITAAIVLSLSGAYYFRHYFYSQTILDKDINQLLTQHARRYQEMEYFSGFSLSISIPGDKIHNYYYGHVSHDKNSAPVTKNTLFEIGSITKSYTAAIMLQLEKEGKLSLQDGLGKYLSQYPRWNEIPLNKLLNMTSCLPNYTSAPEFTVAVLTQPDQVWSNEGLLRYAYPQTNLPVPLRKNFYYSNTNYILAGMVAEKIGKQSLEDAYQSRLIKPANLTNTFYSSTKYPAAVMSRLAHGYSYDPYSLPMQFGKDMTNANLSWSKSAGAVIATSEDIVKWVQALYINNTILDAAQKNKLMTLVSATTGEPIPEVNETEPSGFGIGIFKEANLERLKESAWTFDGRMFGFRSSYIYIPCNNVIVATTFNSSTDDENSHMKELMRAAYELVIKQNPRLRCGLGKR